MTTPPWLSALNLSTGFPLSDALSALPLLRNGSSSTSAGTALAEAAPGTSSVCQQLSRYLGWAFERVASLDIHIVQRRNQSSPTVPNRRSRQVS